MPLGGQHHTKCASLPYCILLNDAACSMIDADVRPKGSEVPLRLR